jgi:hypothetical protein
VRGAYRIHTLILDAAGLKSTASQHAIGWMRRSKQTLIVSALSHNPNRPSEVTAVTKTNADFCWLSGCESRHNKSMRIDRS